MWVIMTEDGRCIVKGKATKSLVELGEPTKKELVSYDSEPKAKSAIMRMLPQPSSAVKSIYGKDYPRLVPTQWNEE